MSFDRRGRHAPGSTMNPRHIFGRFLTLGCRYRVSSGLNDARRDRGIVGTWTSTSGVDAQGAFGVPGSSLYWR
jgi:hypothetical protein